VAGGCGELHRRNLFYHSEAIFDQITGVRGLKLIPNFAPFAAFLSGLGG